MHAWLPVEDMMVKIGKCSGDIANWLMSISGYG